MPVIGIDVGSTYSCVAVCRRGKVEIIPNRDGERRTPSYVAFTTEECVIGIAAGKQLSWDPTNTIFDMKHLIGRDFMDPYVTSHRELWPFEVFSIDDKPMIHVEYKSEERTFSAEDVYAMLLRELKTLSEEYLGEMVGGAVITVPAYFNNAQRTATMNAATLVGFKVLQIIDEPMASALAYGFKQELVMNSNVLIFKLSRRSCDVTVLNIKDSVFELKSTVTDAHLGGEYFDSRMLSHCLDQFQRIHDKDISDSGIAISRLLRACKIAKLNLSHFVNTTIKVDDLYEGIDFLTRITRDRFEELNEDLFEIALKLVKTALRNARMNRIDINHIVITGGCTRIPRVQYLLRNFFHGKTLNSSINHEDVIAYGAAVHAVTLGDDNIGSIHDLRIKPVSRTGTLDVRVSDEEENRRVHVINCLDNYAHGMISKMKEKIVEEKIQESDRANIVKMCEEVIVWLDSKPDVAKEECESRQEELISICTPIITKLFQAGGK